ncbi:MAG TPA: hypothetical protein VFS20_06175 [Longimicrobium sp.]|nr:hypothetical protein [Longimicrobium sp.]
MTDSTAAFVTPQFRRCDTDGRGVVIALEQRPQATVAGRLRLATTETLAPGESRIIVSATDCIQLPASDADYVVSALNTTEQPAEAEPVADLTVWTASAPAPDLAVSRRSEARRHVGPVPPHAPAAARALAWPSPYATTPRLFDPRYASARAGETVRFVDWRRAASCGQAAELAPSYEAAVVATSGLTVIAVDLRLPNAAEYTGPAGSLFLQEAADIADPLIVPTMRRVFDPAYAPLPAAGGRHFHLITAVTGVATATDGSTSKPQSFCALSSEMITTLHVPPALANPLGPRLLATELVHEYAHNADEVTARRHGHPGGSTGWMQESWAVNAEETAARIASGQAMGAQLSRLGDASPFRAGTTNSDWGLYPERSAWTGAGAYKQGAALVSYAREVAGEASLTAADPSLYLRLLAGREWTLHGLAAAVNRSAIGLLDAWALADATDDLSQDGERLASWDDTERLLGNEGPRGGTPAAARPSRAVPRSGGSKDVTLAAAPGSYAAAYIFADAGLGATLRIIPRGPRAIVRLTRTR